MQKPASGTRDRTSPMNQVLESEAAPSGRQTPFPGARYALILLLSINLFNYVDRYVLAAVVGPIKRTFFG